MTHEELRTQIETLLQPVLATYFVRADTGPVTRTINNVVMQGIDLPAVFVGQPPQGTVIVDHGVEVNIQGAIHSDVKGYLGGGTMDRDRFVIHLFNWWPEDINSQSDDVPKVRWLGQHPNFEADPIVYGPVKQLLKRFASLSRQVGHTEPNQKYLEKAIIEIYPPPCYDASVLIQ